MTTITKKKAAIVLATLNGEKWIAAQLLSIKSQLHDNWHVFLRDDGSSDQTIAIAVAMLSPARLTILSSVFGPTGSPAGNFFAALGQVPLEEFDYVSFCDQDDVWSPDKLSRAIECLTKSGAAAYSCDLIAFDNSKNIAWYLSKSQPQKIFDYLFQGASAGCTYVLTRNAAALVKQKTSPLLGVFPKARSHDWLIYSICRSHSLEWFMDQSAHIFYRQHAANAFGGMPGIEGMHARWKLARSGWYREHILWLRQFLANSSDEAVILDQIESSGWKNRFGLIQQCGNFRRTAGDARNLALVIALGLF